LICRMGRLLMANKETLIPQAHELTVEEASKGGKASVEARRRKKDLRQALEMLLDKEYQQRNGDMITGTEAISAKLFEQAMKGNIKAFETIRDSVGQKIPERIMIAEVDQSVIEEVEQAVLKDK